MAIRRVTPYLRHACTRPQQTAAVPNWRVGRSFSASAAVSLRTAAMTEEDFKAIRVSRTRLMDTLHHTCSWGTGHRWGSGPTETGMSRLSLTDGDKQARDWFAETTRSLGCALTVDAMGNMFAVRPGRLAGAAPIFAGSHLDTQPAGGRYDGILGVLAGIEMLTLLRDHGIETEHPVGVVNWTNEEGARFPSSMMASGVWAGDITPEQAYSLKEVGEGGATVREELERIGYLGSTPASYRSTPMSAHFELHIEQGPILEAAKQKVGVVQGAQAYRWYTIDIDGRAAHTGTTPFYARADALLLASRLIARSNAVAARHSALASTGVLALSPGSVNTVPSHVRFALDVRAPLDETVDAVEAELRRDFAAIARGENVDGHPAAGLGSRPLSVAWRTDSVSPAVRFDEDCIAAVRASAAAVLGGAAAGLYRDMTSGAGHDSVHTSRRCPTAMIFVPSRDGVSHNPEEYTSPEDCAVGAEVLCQSVLRFDRRRTEARA